MKPAVTIVRKRTRRVMDWDRAFRFLQVERSGDLERIALCMAMGARAVYDSFRGRKA